MMSCKTKTGFGFEKTPLAWTLMPMCLRTRGLQHVVCCEWKKCMVRWKVEAALKEGQGGCSDGNNKA
jgi:hypothetical protein